MYFAFTLVIIGVLTTYLGTLFDGGCEHTGQLDSAANGAHVYFHIAFQFAHCMIVPSQALCLIDMINQHVLPAARTTLSLSCCAFTSSAHDMPQLRADVTALEAHLSTVQAVLEDIHYTADDRTAAQKSRVLRLDTMIAVRATVDAIEAVVPAHLWTLATYKELLFMDQHVV